MPQIHLSARITVEVIHARVFFQTCKKKLNLDLKISDCTFQFKVALHTINSKGKGADKCDYVSKLVKIGLLFCTSPPLSVFNAAS